MTDRTIDVSSQRLISLDALRGFTIAAMVIVNDPGSWSDVYAPLDHSLWNGITPTDLVFPFFLFIVGVSIVLAYNKRLEAHVPKKDIYRKIVFRTLKIFVVGLLLGLWPHFHFADIRIPGVLQRIAIVFLVCSLLFLNSNWKTQIKVAAILLIGYWLLLALVPVPIDEVIRKVLETGVIERKEEMMVPIEGLRQISDGFIAANYQPGVNITAWFDRLVIPGRFYEVTWDPEGLLSTLPAIVTGISGLLVGRIILDVKDNYQKLAWLFFIGFCMYLVGEFWGLFFPLNKNLWSSSYVMWTSGMATMGLSASILVVDILGYKKWTKLGRVYGANAISSYVLADLLVIVFASRFIGGESLKGLFMDFTTSIGIVPKLASFMYAVVYMLIIYIPAYILYKKRIFIKL